MKKLWLRCNLMSKQSTRIINISKNIHTQLLPREVAPMLTAMWIAKYAQNIRYKIAYMDMPKYMAQLWDRSSWTVCITKYMFIVITRTDKAVATILFSLQIQIMQNVKTT